MTREDFFVALHARDEKFVQHTIQVGSEIDESVGPCCFGDILVILGTSPSLIEKQLVGFGEVCTEALIEPVDEAGERDVFVLGAGGANVGRPLEGIGFAIQQVDCTWVNIDRQPNLAAKERAADVFRRLVSIAEGRPAETEALRFDDEAQEAFDAWRHRLKGRVRAGDLHPAFEAHLSKYRSLLPSLALICHLVDGRGQRIGVRDFYRAEAWCEYLESHATRIYDAPIKADLTAARTLGNRIERGDLPSPFRLRDVYRRCWAGLTSKEAVQTAVEILHDLGWVRPQDAQSGQAGGRPSPLYHINPAVRRTT